MQSVRVDGRRIGYHRAGAGPPLVLLHGGLGDGREWEPQLEGLSDAFDVVAWDAPGCGGSDDPAEGATLGVYADALAGLVGALGLRRVHLCGLSFGGGLALAVYARHPAVVRSLVLVSAYAGWKGSLPAAEVRARVERARAETQQPPETWVDDYLPGFFARDMPREVLDRVRSIMCDVRPAGTLAMLSAFAEADLRDVLPTVTVPTLLLYGDADVRAPRPVADAMRAGIPGAEFELLPGVGHVIPAEVPAEFDSRLRRFLRTVG